MATSNSGQDDEAAKSRLSLSTLPHQSIEINPTSSPPSVDNASSQLNPDESVMSDSTKCNSNPDSSIQTNKQESPVVEEEEEEELEEGELKDDDDDDDDMDAAMMGDAGVRLSGSAMTGMGPREFVGKNNSSDFQATASIDDPNASGQPKKRRKRVVRKVKRKIKVIKKVPKKKSEFQQQAPQSQEQVPPAPSLQQTNQKSPKNNGNNQQHGGNMPLNDQQSQTSKRLLPPPSEQQRSDSNQTSGLVPVPATTLAPSVAATTVTNQQTSLDSLWEQQIQMLQQLQKQQQTHLPQQQIATQPQLQHNQLSHQDQHAQILRAASTDEDLRFFQPPLLFQQGTCITSTTMTATTQSLQPQLSQSQSIGSLDTNMPPFTSTSPMGPASIISMPNMLPMPSLSQPLMTSTSTHNSTNPLGPLLQQFNQQSQPQAQPNMLNQHQQPQPQSQLSQQQPQLTQANQQPPDTTPSSPDDEHGKSSYEAISKMLTMLRNSANITDSKSENVNEADPRLKGQQQRNLQQIQKQHLDSSTDSDTSGNQLDTKLKYSLIPVQVDGIDYTKYKLLSQYEPKFKNDPRLNQQA